MKQVIFTTANQVKELARAIDTLKEQGQIRRDAEKAEKAAKELIRRELQSRRNIDVDSLEEGETVLLTIGTERGLKISRNGSDRIDVDMLRAMQPTIAAQFTKRTVSSRFDVI